KNIVMLFFTTVVDKHNHSIIPSLSTNIAKYCKLGNDIIQFIDFYISYGITSMQNIRRLLRGKFHEKKNSLKNIYNAIQNKKKKIDVLMQKLEFTNSNLTMVITFIIKLQDTINF